jgi:hypothetical protein
MCVNKVSKELMYISKLLFSNKQVLVSNLDFLDGESLLQFRVPFLHQLFGLLC